MNIKQSRKPRADLLIFFVKTISAPMKERVSGKNQLVLSEAPIPYPAIRRDKIPGGYGGELRAAGNLFLNADCV